MICFRNKANLLHRGWLLFGLPNAAKLAHGNFSDPQVRFPDASEFKDEQIAPLRFVQVFGEVWSSEKLLRVLAVDLHCFKEGAPCLMELEEDLIGYFGRERLVRISFFEEMKRGCVIEIG